MGCRSWSWSRSRSRIRVDNDETALLVPLHVPHTSDRLDLRRRGLPVVPVLEISSFKDELAPSVARVHVADPSGEEATQQLQKNRQTDGMNIKRKRVKGGLTFH